MAAFCTLILIGQNSWAVLVEFNGSNGNGQVLGRTYATGSPAVGDQLGKVVFTATDNVAITTYSQIVGSVAPSGGGRLALSARVGSTLTPLLNIDGSGLSLLQGVMTGNGSGLSNLNASAFGSGVLPLAYGGTGVGSLPSGTMPYSTGSALAASQLYYASTNLGVGVSSPSVKLDVAGKVRANSGTTGAPANGVVGGNGDRFIMWPGSASSQPYSLGINSSIFWSSVPSGASYSWYQGGTERMRMNSSGGLDIATQYMAANTFVRLGYASIQGAHLPAIDGYNSNNIDTLYTSSNLYIAGGKSIRMINGSLPSATIANTSAETNGPPMAIQGGMQYNIPLVSINNSLGTALRLKAALNTSSPQKSIFVTFDSSGANAGEISAVAGGTADFAFPSDERLKENIRPTEISARNVINDITVIDYQFRSNQSSDNELKITGFSAQNLLEAYPAAVTKSAPTTDSQEVLMIMPMKLIPVMVKQMQDMQKQIDALQSRLDAIEAQSKTP